METALQDYIDGIRQLLPSYQNSPDISGVLTAIIEQGFRHIPQEKQQLEDAWNRGYSNGCNADKNIK